MAFIAGFGIALWVGGTSGAGLAMALVGVIVGNQVGCFLQEISKLGRLLGVAVLAWNIFDVLTQGIPPDTAFLKGAFLWGFGAMSTFSSEELAIIRIQKDDRAEDR